MSEQSGDKSFDATPHRRQQAREQGQVVHSQDLGSAALLLVGVLVLMNWGGAIIDVTIRYMEQQLGTVETLTPDRSDIVLHSVNLLRTFGVALLPILALLAVAGALSTILQIGLLFVPEKLQPDLSLLSLLGGAKRILSLQGVVRLAFGLFKIAIIAVVAGFII